MSKCNDDEECTATEFMILTTDKVSSSNLQTDLSINAALQAERDTVLVADIGGYNVKQFPPVRLRRQHNGCRKLSQKQIYAQYYS